MNNRYPFAPDMNAPSGMPANYPYGPPPGATSNPMLPPGFKPTYSNTSATPYPATPSYPSASPYPSSSPYPPHNPSSYPSASPYPSAQPYPSSSPYPPSAHNASSYPSTSPYPSSSPYAPSYPQPAHNISPSPYPPQAHNTSPYPHTAVNNPSSTVPYPPNAHNLSNSSSVYPGASPSGHNMHVGNYPPDRSMGQNYSISRHTPSPQNRYPGYLTSRAMEFAVFEGTVKPYPAFNAQEDAQVLRKAMKGFGTDEKAIIAVLANRSNEQRVYIAVAFKQLFGKDLIDDLKSELKGNFEDVIIGLMTPTNEYLASEVHKAISGIGTDEDILIEVLCTRTNQEIWSINEAYTRLYGKNLEDDIKGDTSGHFQRLLVSTITGARSEAPADEDRAKQTAHELYSAGVGQWGTDESVFNMILVGESFHQLLFTFYEYQKLAGHTVAEAIEKEMSGDIKKGMLAIAQSVENRPLYFATRLYKAMKGLGTDDQTLIRIVVSRCELDMVQIKAEYERSFGKPLADAIKGDTSGDYRKVLIALVGGY